MRRRLFCILFLMLLLFQTLGAESTGLVVRSPLYGESVEESIATPLPIASYGEQLGLSPESAQMTASNANTVAQQRVLAAISDQNYPVTPGDVYQLEFTDGTQRIQLRLQVEGNGHIDIPNLESVDASHMSLPQLKEKVFSLVSTYYSYANPLFTLLSTGSFSVSVVGEVKSKTTYDLWGLSRLSSVIDAATPYASTRKVEVKGSDGSVHSYDLYKAMRKGDFTQDPLLKAGDIVTFLKAERMVSLSGAVRTTGTFQLLEGEQLRSLLTAYGGGLLPGADITRIRMQRFDEAGRKWNIFFVNLGDPQTDQEIVSMDQVMLDSVPQGQKRITIEGAVTSVEANNPEASATLLGQSSGRLFYQYFPGEDFDTMVRNIAPRFLTVSDLEHAYLKRDGKRVMVDLLPILTGKSSSGITMQDDDVLVIPFNQRFVTVSGAVTRSGVYAYVPDKTASYYLALAGGATSDAAHKDSWEAKDKEGTRLDKDAIIPEEATIYVRPNTFVKNLAPTVAVIGLVSSLLSIVYTIAQTQYYFTR